MSSKYWFCAMVVSPSSLLHIDLSNPVSVCGQNLNEVIIIFRDLLVMSFSFRLFSSSPTLLKKIEKEICIKDDTVRSSFGGANCSTKMR